MLQKISRYYHTLKHVKPIQLYYQLYYRFKRVAGISYHYDDYNNSSVIPVKTKTKGLIVADGKYLGDKRFVFLNQQKHFTENIDWSFAEYGKLWNYNLHYFDFLLAKDNKQHQEYFGQIIEEYSSLVLQNKLKPEPYPASLRIINWILYSSQTGFTSSQSEKALKKQIAYLKHNLEFHLLANHLLENYVSLFVAAYWLKDEKLFDFSFNGIKTQLQEQVLDDGAHYECSPMYHCIILSKLLLMYDIAEQNEWKAAEVKNALKPYLEKMLGWLSAFKFRNNTTALFNDAAEGVAPSVEVLKEAAIELNLSAQQSQLNDSGYRKFENDWCEAVIDVGNIIPTYQPGHAHADMLSFCMCVNDKPFIIDPGVSTYNPGKQRNKERSTVMHNTVVVNGKDQSEVWGGFRVAKRARVKIEKDEQNLCAAYHNGYLSEGVIHKRTFTLNKSAFKIEDILEEKAASSYKAEAFFYFDSSVNIAANSNKLLTNVASVEFFNAEKIEVFTYQQPKGFNILKEAFAAKVAFKGSLQTVIAPNENFIYN